MKKDITKNPIVKSIPMYLFGILFPWILLIPAFPINIGNIMGFVVGSVIFYLITLLTTHKGRFIVVDLSLPIVLLLYIACSNLLQYIPKKIYDLNFDLYYSIVFVAIAISILSHIVSFKKDTGIAEDNESNKMGTTKKSGENLEDPQN